MFRLSDDDITAEYPVAWDHLEERSLCDRRVYNLWAHWLTTVYRKANVEFIDADYILSLMRQQIHKAKNKFDATGSGDTKCFFSCLDMCVAPRAASAQPHPPPMPPPLAPPTPRSGREPCHAVEVLAD